MPTAQRDYGKRIEDAIQVVDLFHDSFLCQWYGRPRNGKTALATMSAIQDWQAGQVVYTSWPISVESFDERRSLFHLIRGLMFPWSKLYLKLSPDNLRTIDVYRPDIIEYLRSLTDCTIYLDEGHRVFNSYELTKIPQEKQELLLHTGHFNRTIHVISQRPTALHTVLRENVEMFYKCEKLMKWPFLLFRKTEFFDMVGNTVDEDAPSSAKWIIGKKKYLNAYNTRYLRGDTPTSQTLLYEAYMLNYGHKIKALYDLMKENLATLVAKFKKSKGT